MNKSGQKLAEMRGMAGLGDVEGICMSEGVPNVFPQTIANLKPVEGDAAKW